MQRWGPRRAESLGHWQMFAEQRPVAWLDPGLVETGIKLWVSSPRGVALGTLAGLGVLICKPGTSRFICHGTVWGERRGPVRAGLVLTAVPVEPHPICHRQATTVGLIRKQRLLRCPHRPALSPSR